MYMKSLKNVTDIMMRKMLISQKLLTQNILRC